LFSRVFCNCVKGLRERNGFLFIQYPGPEGISPIDRAGTEVDKPLNTGLSADFKNLRGTEKIDFDDGAEIPAFPFLIRSDDSGVKDPIDVVVLKGPFERGPVPYIAFDGMKFTFKGSKGPEGDLGRGMAAEQNDLFASLQ
jgi:hypothetical protein